MKKNKLNRLGHSRAADLSNFAGKLSSDINIVDFAGGCTSFADEANSIQDRAIKFSFKNLGKVDTVTGDAYTYTASRVNLNLSPGQLGFEINGVEFKSTDSEELVLAITDNAADEYHIAVSGQPHGLKEFMGWVIANPVNVVMMKLNVNNALQFDEQFTYTYFDPFVKTKETPAIRIQDHVDEYAFNTKIVTIKDGLVLDANTNFSLGLIEDADISLTFYCGAVINQGKGLSKAVKQSGQYFNRRKGLGGLRMTR